MRESDHDATTRWFTSSGLDETSLPAFRDRIIRYEQGPPPANEPRTYPGYPRVQLPRARCRFRARLDATLVERRCTRALGLQLPTCSQLGRVLQYSHAVCSEEARGPTPSAGNLQALELYVVALEQGWLDRSAYHYDRVGHHLSRLLPMAPREQWEATLPSKRQFEGGSLLWVIVGDTLRPEAKYGARAFRFLLLEAGHLMQNLCLVSRSVGLCTLPLGGFFEREVSSMLELPESDVVLYVGVCGTPVSRV